jgi:hypothetical protein
MGGGDVDVILSVKWWFVRWKPRPKGAGDQLSARQNRQKLRDRSEICGI